MKDPMKIAQAALEEVCGEIAKPDARDIVRHCTPLLAGHVNLSDSEDANWENEEKAVMLRNAFIMGYVCGQNSTY